MSDFLDAMARISHERVMGARTVISEKEVRRRAQEHPKRQRLSLHPGGFDIIAEIKLEAPSAGALHDGNEAKEEFIHRQTDAYARGGACAISVLTEPNSFKGNIDDLNLAAAASPLPVMRKDFLVDPYQVFEARAHGSSGVLLIARLLEQRTVPEFLEAARITQQFVLLEIFDDAELDVVETAVRLSSELDVTLMIGVNARNLSTLDVDTDRFSTFATRLPSEVPHVAESGLETVNDVRAVASLGYRAALIGTALMRSDNPSRLLSELTDAGREAATTCS